MYRPDTSPEVQKIYDQRIKNLSPEERFLRGLSLTRFSRELCVAGIRDRQPGISEKDLRVALFDQVYGSEFSPGERERIRHFLLHFPQQI